MRLVVDMDGVFTHFNKTVWDTIENDYPNTIINFPRPNPVLDFYVEDAYDDPHFKKIVYLVQQTEGFFKRLEPIKGAIEALHELEKDFEVFICTAPLLENPTCTNDKLWWVDNHLGGDWIRRTIITKDKTVVDGDFLIDDKPLITGITDEPIWQRIIFDQPYNKNVVGRRLNWQNYKQVIDKLW